MKTNVAIKNKNIYELTVFSHSLSKLEQEENMSRELFENMNLLLEKVGEKAKRGRPPTIKKVSAFLDKLLNEGALKTKK